VNGGNQLAGLIKTKLAEWAAGRVV